MSRLVSTSGRQSIAIAYMFVAKKLKNGLTIGRRGKFRGDGRTRFAGMHKRARSVSRRKSRGKLAGKAEESRFPREPVLRMLNTFPSREFASPSRFFNIRSVRSHAFAHDCCGVRGSRVLRRFGGRCIRICKISQYRHRCYFRFSSPRGTERPRVARPTGQGERKIRSSPPKRIFREGRKSRDRARFFSLEISVVHSRRVSIGQKHSQ